MHAVLSGQAIRVSIRLFDSEFSESDKLNFLTNFNVTRTTNTAYHPENSIPQWHTLVEASCLFEGFFCHLRLGSYKIKCNKRVWIKAHLCFGMAQSKLKDFDQTLFNYASLVL